MGEKEDLQAKLLPILKRLIELVEDEKESAGLKQTLSQAEGERNGSAVATRSPSQSSPAQSTLIDDPVGDSIKKLDWHKSDYGEWSFRFKEKGSRDQTPEQRTLSNAIEAAGGKLVVGKLEYTLPQGKPFISRKESKK